MRILKGTGSYLMEQAKISKIFSYVLFAIGGLGLIYSIFSFNFGLIFILAIILHFGGFFFNKYADYSKGLESEKIVTKYLKNLSDEYYLINDVKIPDSNGNVDHIILGPNGIFAIETKGFEGLITCNGDKWYQYKQEWKNPEFYERKSPSIHVKFNALRLKKFIESKNFFKKPLKIWIEGVVVFTNEEVRLKINKPTVTVLKITDLVRYIKYKKSKLTFSSQELESIGKAILELVEVD